MKKGLVYWIVTILLYGFLLGLFSDQFLQLSYFYHALIFAFPVVLIVLKRETFRSVGLVRGDLKTGIEYIALIAVFAAVGVFAKAWIFGKPVYIMSETSWMFLLIVAVAPITEEIFHRGYLQTKFEKSFGRKQGLVIASVMFSLIHLPKILFANELVSTSIVPAFLTSPIFALPLFFGLGMLYGYIYQETKSINYSIATHGIANFVLYFLRF